MYAAALAVAWVLALVIRAVLRAGPKKKDAGPLDVYTLALLGGGTPRVVDTAVQALVGAGRLRAARNHTITACGQGTPDDPVQREVLSCVQQVRSTNLAGARRLATSTDAVRSTAETAVAEGYLISAPRRRAARATALLPGAVLAVGVARLVNGIRLNRPVALLVLALLATSVVVLVLAVSAPRLTRVGTRAREQARQRSTAGRGATGFYRTSEAAVPAAVLSVAALGAAGVADLQLRSAIYGSLAAASSSSGGGGSSSSFSCGGSGCGGGGGCGGCGG